MKKAFRIILPILALILCAALALPAGAAEINRGVIRNTCSTLDTYLYPEVYQDREGYAAYQEKLAAAKAATADISLSDDELVVIYNDLRASYVALMKNTYDFSGLEEIVAAESQLNKDLYEEDGWAAFEEEAAACRNTLNGPALYHINDRSVAEYRTYMQTILDEQEKEAVAAYNALRLKDLPETFDAAALSSLVSAMKGLTDHLDLSGAPSFTAYTVAASQAETVLKVPNANRDRVNAAAQDIIAAYNRLIGEALDLSAPRAMLERAEGMGSSDYTVYSWSFYETERAALTKALSQPILLRIPACIPEGERSSFVDGVIASLSAPLKKAEEELLPEATLVDLSDLCERYANIAVNDQLEQYDTALIQAVENGKKLLERNDLTLSEVKTATETIEGAAEQLKIATESLNESTSQAKSEQSKNTHLILGFLLVALLASAGLAVFMSLRENGYMDWTR